MDELAHSSPPDLGPSEGVDLLPGLCALLFYLAPAVSIILSGSTNNNLDAEQRPTTYSTISISVGFNF